MTMETKIIIPPHKLGLSESPKIVVLWNECEEDGSAYFHVKPQILCKSLLNKVLDYIVSTGTTKHIYQVEKIDNHDVKTMTRVDLQRVNQKVKDSRDAYLVPFSPEVKIGFFELGLDDGGIFYVKHYEDTQHAEAYIVVWPAIVWWMQKKKPKPGLFGLRYKDSTQDRIQRLLWSKQMLQHKYAVEDSYNYNDHTYITLWHSAECVDELCGVYE